MRVENSAELRLARLLDAIIRLSEIRSMLEEVDAGLAQALWEECNAKS